MSASYSPAVVGHAPCRCLPSPPLLHPAQPLTRSCSPSHPLHWRALFVILPPVATSAVAARWPAAHAGDEAASKM
eukprot:5780348-Pyramimonas_sp.AAC.1